MVTIPYAILHLLEGEWSPKMDQQWLLHQLETNPRFEQVTDTEAIFFGGILIVQGGESADHAAKIRDILASMPWAVLVVTSDECATFPWHQLSLRPHLRYWAQLPQRRIGYPAGTGFFGEMPGRYENPAPRPASERTHLVTFRGQVQNQRRSACVNALNEMDGGQATVTGGFMQGDRQEYLDEIEDSVFVACPSGNCTQSTFRAFEALEAGAIPIVDAVAPHQENPRYWERIGMGWLPQIESWESLPEVIEAHMAAGVDETQAILSERWSEYKKELMDGLAASAVDASWSQQ